ncbi:hypothetical protein LC087_08140 [Bacillus carboniphilus]|uniref:Glycosyltransferase 2-like domain-containing protein n=1 Tax=Bacillus carboniphilus TaxID=86663 RepID=A0ABY9JZ49_9BACI|nr:hypothetical protein [Bacillus carboniphilus]WLR44054.1 hypothetical protein LC087_08140 [Bacillus carboniphilus]
MTIKLSILIPSISDHLTELDHLIKKLQKQTANQPVEILAFIDNKKRTTDSKRDSLKEEAKGDFIIFIEDHTEISSNYVDELLSTLEKNSTNDFVNKGIIKK